MMNTQMLTLREKDVAAYVAIATKHGGNKIPSDLWLKFTPAERKYLLAVASKARRG